MKTKKVILIRHGDYNDQVPFNLSEWGKKDILELAVRLLSEIKNKEVIFLSSMANRATQSAEILQKKWEENKISLSFEKKYEIWSGTDAYKEFKRLRDDEKKTVSVYDRCWLTDFITTSDKEVIVVVTHSEFVNDYPSELNFYPERDIEKGEALILDFETNTCFVV